jgi:hypothetical protein
MHHREILSSQSSHFALACTFEIWTNMGGQKLPREIENPTIMCHENMK